MQSKKIYKKNPNFVARKIEDEIILVPIKKDAADFEAIYNLNNDTSVRIWELIDGKNSLDEIKEKISNEFPVAPKKLEKDLGQFVKDLEKIGAIKEQATSYRLQATGNRLQATGNRLQATGNRLQAAG